MRRGHPLATAKEHSLETVLVFPLVSPRLPQRIAGHFGKLATHSRIDRDTGDLTPNLLVDNFSLALKTVLGGDAVGLAPLVTLETELRARRIALLSFTMTRTTGPVAKTVMFTGADVPRRPDISDATARSA